MHFPSLNGQNLHKNFENSSHIHACAAYNENPCCKETVAMFHRKSHTGPPLASSIIIILETFIPRHYFNNFFSICIFQAKLWVLNSCFHINPLKHGRRALYAPPSLFLYLKYHETIHTWKFLTLQTFLLWIARWKKNEQIWFSPPPLRAIMNIGPNPAHGRDG